jgi:hypothetical protein
MCFINCKGARKLDDNDRGMSAVCNKIRTLFLAFYHRVDSEFLTLLLDPLLDTPKYPKPTRDRFAGDACDLPTRHPHSSRKHRGLVCSSCRT